ncbi:MAG: tRNA lysidine(34) synthetase TilS [Bacteroidales bacterium]|nr:tRNA lysidine(34) synthetase TilS [Bacteroidales bacterium]
MKTSKNVVLYIMLKQFTEFIEKENLFKKNDRIILAVSGGIDSVAMCDLFYKAEFNFSVAHCNFGLREQESDMDELFVQELAHKYKASFFSELFETKKYSEENKISIQMAARELRYGWFNWLTETTDYKYVAIAHHFDDVVETFFINILRGTGISGLHGIAAKNKKIIRPLLFAKRKEIEEYVLKNKLKYREDKSNNENKYLRNKIRHDIIPIFKEIHPEFENTIKGNIERLKDVEKIYKNEIEKVQKNLVVENKNTTTISIKELKKINPLRTYLYELLSPFNFNFSNVGNIIENLDDISGKQFLSPTHRLIKDRNELIITKINDEQKNEYLINYGDTLIEAPLKISIRKTPFNKSTGIQKDKNTATFDADKLSFPLKIRKWENGDCFHPFGMKNKKKLSDFFIDEKFSLVEKENTWVVCSGNKIAWIAGHRIDDRFKVDDKTKNILQLKIL